MSDKPVPVFSNFGKATNDFFTKGFPANHKLEIATKAENGLTFTNSIEQKRKDKQESYLGKLETKYKHEGHGLELSGTVDTDNVIKGEVSINKLGLTGLKLVAKPQVGKSKEVSGGFEFQNKNVSLASSLLYKGNGDVLVNIGLVGSNGFFSGGLESNYFLKTGNNASGFETVRGLLSYRTPSLEVLLSAKNQWTFKEDSNTASQKLTLSAGYEHKAGDATTLHSSLDYDTTKSGAEAVAVKFGGAHKLDSDTSFQGKVDTEGKLGVSFAKQFNPNVKGTFTTEFDFFSLSGSDHKIALGLSFKA